jgi:hypothetical protein
MEETTAIVAIAVGTATSPLSRVHSGNHVV